MFEARIYKFIVRLRLRRVLCGLRGFKTTASTRIVAKIPLHSDQKEENKPVFCGPIERAKIFANFHLNLADITYISSLKISFVK